MLDIADELFALYRETFPANERRPEADLRAALATAEYRLLKTYLAGELIGFAILFVPAKADFALLEYLAVAPACRSRGIGRALVDSVLDQIQNRTLLIEVESDPIDPIAIRRRTFYARCAFHPIPHLKYTLPLPGNPPAMQLWTNRAPPLNPTDLAHYLTTIYTKVYQCEPTDSRLTKMLHSLH